MSQRIKENTKVLPPVHIDALLYDQLFSLATSGAQHWPEASSLLLREIERATLTPADALPDNVATIGSTVTYEDLHSGRTRSVTLVFPQDADIQENRVSVLTPIGAALIGLAPGQTFHWLSASGIERRIAIKDVRSVS